MNRDVKSKRWTRITSDLHAMSTTQTTQFSSSRRLDHTTSAEYMYTRFVFLPKKYPFATKSFLYPLLKHLFCFQKCLSVWQQADGYVNLWTFPRSRHEFSIRLGRFFDVLVCQPHSNESAMLIWILIWFFWNGIVDVSVNELISSSVLHSMGHVFGDWIVNRCWLTVNRNSFLILNWFRQVNCASDEILRLVYFTFWKKAGELKRDSRRMQRILDWLLANWKSKIYVREQQWYAALVTYVHCRVVN